jgi:hypothetical protein
VHLLQRLGPGRERGAWKAQPERGQGGVGQSVGARSVLFVRGGGGGALVGRGAVGSGAAREMQGAVLPLSAATAQGRGAFGGTANHLDAPGYTPGSPVRAPQRGGEGHGGSGRRRVEEGAAVDDVSAVHGLAAVGSPGEVYVPEWQEQWGPEVGSAKGLSRWPTGTGKLLAG